MKITVSQKLLNKGLNTVTRSVSLKATLPVLNNVMLQAEQGRLRLSATNLESGVHCWVGAKIEGEGGSTVPARVFADFVASLGEEEKVILELEEETLTVSSASNQARLSTISASEFPKVPVLEGEPNLELNLKEFAKGINQVSFAASFDEGRPVLTGVLIKVGKKQTELVATDGYRLAKKTLSGEANGELEVIIPARTLQEVARIANDSEEEVLGITRVENQALFSIGATQVIARVIDGSYPNYEQIIPKEVSTEVNVSKDKFSKALKTASIFARDLGNVIRVEIAKEGEVALLANTLQIGQGVSRLEAAVTGKGLKTAFNAKYLTEALSAVSADKLYIESAGAVNPAIIKGEEDNFFSLVMPVRVQN